MFRIRRIFDDVLPANRRALAGAQQILQDQIPELTREDVESLGTALRDPFPRRLKPILFVAESPRRGVTGFALLLHAPDLEFAYLEYIASSKGWTSGGVGGALYGRLREEAVALGCRAVLFECLPDDPAEGTEPAKARANAARLRFYEGFDARPVAGTGYQTPIDPADTSPQPMLVLDRLGRDQAIVQSWLRKVVRAILERKYAELCPPRYVDRVVGSFRGETASLRPYRYLPDPGEALRPVAPFHEEILLAVNDRHDIHHVRERGYVESPVRIPRILEAIDPTGWFRRLEVRKYPQKHLTAVHDPGLVRYLERASKEVEKGHSLYPYVFPIRNRARLPKDRTVLAGYYCIDTFTPIHRNSYLAARRAVDVTLTMADEIAAGARFAYSLVRPPGHHAEYRSFGGFCYFNNAAVAAHYLSQHGRVAILDIDYHHGNGQQDIFYQRADVLTISIHGDPGFAYPYFCGFAEEQGEGPGEGANLNLPLPEKVDGAAYLRALRVALERVQAFAPLFLVVALGLDPAKGDPTGSWSLKPEDFAANGRAIAALDLPTLVVQEGGYRTRTLGQNARAFFEGLAGG